MPEDAGVPLADATVNVASPSPLPPPSATASAAPAAAAPDEEPQTMERRLWVLYPLATMAISAVSGGVNGALLAKLIATFPGAGGASDAATLGLTLSVSSVAYLAFTPIGGILSDRTRTRFLGRRNLWVFAGSLVGALALLALGTASSKTSVVILASAATIPIGVILAATSAVVPERVPLSKRGRIASLNGMMGLVGAGLGIAASALAPTVFIGFVIIAVQLVVFCSLFAFFTRDVAPPARPQKRARTRIVFPTPKSNPDYWWTFAARGLAFLAYGLATGLQLYALRDFFRVGDGTTDAASSVLPQIVACSTLALAVAAVLGGLLVDKFQRIKPFVIASSLLFVPGAAVLALVPTLPGAFIGFTIIGLAFGSYISVDGVLMTRVIPNKTNAGRDLGILNISGSVGSILAPAIAGAMVASTGYGVVFLLVIVASALATGAVVFIRSVR